MVVSAPSIVWIAVGLSTTLALVAMIAALARHLILLGRTVGRFRDEIEPLAQEIASETDRVSSRSAQLSSERPFGRS